MSVAVDRWLATRESTADPHRLLAIGSAALLSLAYLLVLYRIVDVVGGTNTATLVAISAGALALAVLFAETLPPRRALAIGGGLFLGGLLLYRLTLPRIAIDLAWQVEGTAALLTGWSVLHLTKAGVWALAYVPGPLFVSWYFVLRRHYGAGVLVGGAALGLFVLSGDASLLTGLLGAVGALGAVGFGRLELEGGTPFQRNALVALLAIVLAIATTVSLVPGGEAQPLLPGGGEPTLEASLVDAGDSLSVQGSIELSTAPRFNVTANEPAYWRVGAYDRYTGDGWVRTGSAERYAGPQPRPPGSTVRIEQEVEVRSRLSTMPAAWKPVEVGIGAEDTRVTELGGLQPDDGFDPGEFYTVTSYAPAWTPDRLRNASDDYPDRVVERYLQLPESTPDRVGRFTDQITAEADTDYDTAVVIERWLERNKEYSLDVREPEGDVASTFLFERDRGYCTYYATTMVVMLRTQGIPARFVAGYTPGQRVAENKWSVRGLDSHAWVEAYFPGTGWVRFDPTPAGPRRDAEQSRFAEGNVNRLPEAARTESDAGGGTETTPNVSEIDPPAASLNEGEEELIGQVNTPSTPTLTPEDLSGVGSNEDAPTETPEGGSDAGGGDGGLPSLPPRQTVLYGAILFAGAIAATYRSGLLDRGYRLLWLRRAPHGEPAQRVERIVDRLEYLLGREYRRRRPDETRREYWEALRSEGLDDRATEIYQLYERARYAGDVTEEEAAEAWERFADLRAER